MADLNTKTFTLDTLFDAKSAVTETTDGDILIEGWASDTNPDRYGDVVMPGAFEDSLKSFLETNPILLYNHDVDKPLGRVLDLEQKPEGLWMKALVAKAMPGSWAEDVNEKIRRGLIKGLSVRGKMQRPFGRDAKSGQALVTHVDLAEISITPLPVNSGSLFAVTQKAFGDPEDAATAEQAEAIQAYFAERFGKVEAAVAALEAATAKPENTKLDDAKKDLYAQLDAINTALDAAHVATESEPGVIAY